MDDGLLFIYDALRVPQRALSDDDAIRRSAAAMLLRSTPALSELLRYVEGDTPFPDRVWRELDVALALCGLVIESVAATIESGELNPILGAYPSTDRRRPRELVAPLEARIAEGVQLHDVDWQIANDVSDALSLGEPDVKPPIIGWSRVVLRTLLGVLVRHATGSGWPLDPGAGDS